MKTKILLVEDESDFMVIVADTLDELGYDVICAEDGIDGLDKFKRYGADIVVADVMMPRLDGFSMSQAIRQLSPNVPLLFLTAKSTIEDVEEGFRVGADDYLRKPFELRELHIRIKALLRRYNKNNDVKHVHHIGKYTFYVTSQMLELNETNIELSYFESRILENLILNVGGTVDASQLMNEIWRRDDNSTRNSLHGYIHKLRKIPSRDPAISIINQRGFGYSMVIKET